MDTLAPTGITWYQIRNTTSQAIPANALVWASGVDSDGTIAVGFCTTAGQTSGYLVNGGSSIAPGAYGQAHTQFPCAVAYDVNTGTPTAGQSWGCNTTSWPLTSSQSGFVVVGGANTAAGLVVVDTAGPSALVTTYQNSLNTGTYPNFTNSATAALTVDGTYGLTLTNTSGVDQLTIFPASSTKPGIVTTGTQQFVGNKEFTSGAIVDGVCFVNGTLEAGVTGSSGYTSLTQFVAAFVGPSSSGTVSITGNSTTTPGASNFLTLSNSNNSTGSSPTSLIFDNAYGASYPGAALSASQLKIYSNNSSTLDYSLLNSNSLSLLYSYYSTGITFTNSIIARPNNFPVITLQSSASSGSPSTSQIQIGTNDGASSPSSIFITELDGGSYYWSVGFALAGKTSYFQFGQTQLSCSDQTGTGINNGTLKWNGDYIATQTAYKIGTTIGASGTDSVGSVFSGGICTKVGSSSAGSGTVTSVGLSMPAIFSVSGSPVTGSGTLTVSLASEAQNTVFAGPASGGSGTPTFRALTAADLPGGTGSGSVTSVGLSLPGIFSVTGTPVTTSGTLTGTLASQNANLVFAGPSSGPAAAPTFRSLTAADLPGGVAGTVTSVALSLPSNFAVTGSPVTGSGTLTATWNTVTANYFFCGPNGSTGTPSFRAIVSADLPVGSSTILGAVKVDNTSIVATAGVISTSGLSGTFSYGGNTLTFTKGLLTGATGSGWSSS